MASGFEEDADFQCPYCGETISVRIDRSAGSRQTFIQDCEVCCRPISFHARVGADGEVDLDAASDG